MIVCELCKEECESKDGWPFCCECRIKVERAQVAALLELRRVVENLDARLKALESEVRA